ncbi:hypothetical protein GOP47_0015525 [Adiantum capillus-veneris]|uniref:DNA mismatch repair protein S5 domain-containing protein n=1 Tax=Adiantum capillus-veneris TaxID=13818 RepID=A0A9D4UKI7_ADICA|nr:hypothetical protein GOP47_0015525 [Adiantum capillus-veneris]
MEVEAVAPAKALPPQIRRLDEAVVNRIAAGEVIQRPASALKELLENSIDAGSSSIAITVKEGGLKLIQIADNGHGIRYEDLPILCERHTTSKLKEFEDLQTINTLGFRGEALASMTFVAHLTVTTMTADQNHGYRASYKDGVMEGEPRPCAAVKGTQIMVENLFYNVAARRKAFKNPAEEYGRILDVVSKFSIHKNEVSFLCKKHGDSRADVHTMASTTRLDAIRAVYGPGVARELIEVSASDDDPLRAEFEMKGFITSANYSAKKTTFVLFINDRLVECSALRKAIEVVYAAILPKASKPFVYMSICLPSEHVDVNVHPTKKEVSFLNQEALVDSIQKAVEAKLMTSNTSRTFYTQTMLPGAAQVSNGISSEGSPTANAGVQSQKAPVNKLVRVDSSNPAGRLHAFLHKKDMMASNSDRELAATRRAVRQRRNPNESADLTSVQELLETIDQETHAGLWDILKNCSYIGMADHLLALSQHKTQLYLFDVVKLSKELMYQQALRRFGRFNAMSLTNPAPVHDLVLLALDEEERLGRWTESDGSKDEIAKLNTKILLAKAEMLREYFAFDVDAAGNVCTIPVVLDQYTPDMDCLPRFLLSLGNCVDWDTEKMCFETFAAALADFYAMHPPMLPNPTDDGLSFFKLQKGQASSQAEKASQEEADMQMEDTDIDEELVGEAEKVWAQRVWTIEHVLFPALRLFLKPPKHMATDGTAVQVACLENLYRIFERC